MGNLETKKLKVFEDEEGRLFETLRADDSIFEGEFGQNLVSVIKPGVIKGLHIHEKTVEYTTCVKGDILYVAIKDGEKPEIEKIVIGESNMVMLKTPVNIWHGYVPLYGKEAVVLYSMNHPYDPDNPDIDDKDPHAFGEDIWNP